MVGLGRYYENKSLANAKKPVACVLRVASEQLISQKQLLGCVSCPQG